MTGAKDSAIRHQTTFNWKLRHDLRMNVDATPLIVLRPTNDDGLAVKDSRADTPVPPFSTGRIPDTSAVSDTAPNDGTPAALP